MNVRRLQNFSNITNVRTLFLYLKRLKHVAYSSACALMRSLQYRMAYPRIYISFSPPTLGTRLFSMTSYTARIRYRMVASRIHTVLHGVAGFCFTQRCVELVLAVAGESKFVFVAFCFCRPLIPEDCTL